MINPYSLTLLLFNSPRRPGILVSKILVPSLGTSKQATKVFLNIKCFAFYIFHFLFYWCLHFFTFQLISRYFQDITRNDIQIYRQSLCLVCSRLDAWGYCDNHVYMLSYSKFFFCSDILDTNARPIYSHLILTKFSINTRRSSIILKTRITVNIILISLSFKWNVF